MFARTEDEIDDESLDVVAGPPLGGKLAVAAVERPCRVGELRVPDGATFDPAGHPHFVGFTQGMRVPRPLMARRLAGMTLRARSVAHEFGEPTARGLAPGGADGGLVGAGRPAPDFK